MSAEKANYPQRPARRNAPKSSHSGGRRSKTWVSLGDVNEGGRDISPRRNTPWWKSPARVAARLAKASSLRAS